MVVDNGRCPTRGFGSDRSGKRRLRKASASIWATWRIFPEPADAGLATAGHLSHHRRAALRHPAGLLAVGADVRRARRRRRHHLPASWSTSCPARTRRWLAWPLSRRNSGPAGMTCSVIRSRGRSRHWRRRRARPGCQARLDARVADVLVDDAGLSVPSPSAGRAGRLRVDRWEFTARATVLRRDRRTTELRRGEIPAETLWLRLQMTSEYPTLDVVKTDIPSVAPPPPANLRSTAVPSAALILREVAGRTVRQLQDDLTRVLRAAQPSRQLSELADDGSPKIPSLVAVFLLSQVGAAVGRPRLVNLSRVRREDMRSLGGVARLVHRTLQPVPAGPLAS